ncbi:ribose import ATP-binding protein RbsA 1 [Gemmatimonadetes bacterium T265]|nr:ribose import ATP-binding protein RbsA 1 [Gemmatimonadetes bacterium T265]
MPNVPAGATLPGAPLLDAAGVHKRYGGVHALRGVRLDVRAGEVHALVGENGAGKSTIINVLAGAVRRDEGRVTFGGREVDFRSPAESQAAGIAVIHQELATIPALSVAENLFMGRMPTRGGRLGVLDRRAMAARARELLAEVGLAVDPRVLVRELSLSNQQLVEIAKALSAGARLLIMDEPSASLTEHETQNLLGLVRRLRAQGVAILYISHRMHEVFAVSDRITVFRDGGYVRTVDTADVTPAAVVGLMVGRELAAAHQRDSSSAVARPVGETVLEVRGLTRRGGGEGGSVPLDDVSFTVRRGEIVGMAGLVGAGRSEAARAIFGADPFDAGEIRLAGKPVRFGSPSAAIAGGVGMVPEDRKGLALFLAKPVRWNVSMAALPRLRRGGIIPRGRERALAADYVERLRVRTPGVEAPVGALSGGNQQKTVLARWLATNPKLLILDEPTHGVDVGAKAEIYELVRALARDGLAILLISSELPEVLDLSDRVVVMRGGRVAATLDRAAADERTVMLHATGTGE